jgi:hypothetical protein
MIQLLLIRSIDKITIHICEFNLMMMLIMMRVFMMFFEELFKTNRFKCSSMC